MSKSQLSNHDKRHIDEYFRNYLIEFANQYKLDMNDIVSLSCDFIKLEHSLATDTITQLESEITTYENTKPKPTDKNKHKSTLSIRLDMQPTQRLKAKPAKTSSH